MSTQLEQLFDNQKAMFISQKGVDKYSNLYSKISNCNKLAQLEGMSIHGGRAPQAQDFSMVATSNWSIFFKFDPITTIMGALIALKIWNEAVNQRYNMASDYEIYNTAIGIIRTNGGRV